MNQENKICQNCRSQFTIEPEDFAFYERIQVSPPTWCPECRMLRRMVFRNESTWYKRTCDATGKSIVSMFAPDKPYKVYEQNYWRSDAWDPLAYGLEYDFSKSFFEQFKNLFKAVPHPNLIQRNCINSEYANYALNQKNTYIVGGGETVEDSAYIFGSNIRVKNCFDTYRVGDMEYCYQVVDCEKSSHLYFSQNCMACNNSIFLYDCRNCTNCFGCVGLRNKQYHIFNQPYTREEYENEIKKIQTGSQKSLEKTKTQFEDLKLKMPRRFAWIIKSENVVGDDIINSKNCYYCFNARNNIENCKFSYRLFENTKDGYDAFVAWNNTELFYEVFSVSGQNIIGSALIWGGFNIKYSYNCFDCNNILGCVGLRNKSYCIFNKQYSKKDYGALEAKIVKQMKENQFIDAKGKKYGYGDFFPPEVSPFAYNESVAQGYFPKNKGEAIQYGFSWREPDKKEYKITKLQIWIFLERTG